jgi:transposase InsO family protein
LATPSKTLRASVLPFALIAFLQTLMFYHLGSHKSSIKMFEEIIFPRFGTPRLLISDGGSHFIDKHFEKYLMNHGIQHNVATPYHPQTSGQAETSNK